MDVTMTVRTRAPLAATEERVRQALADQGFGILTEIDVAATIKKKLGIDRPPMRILGACNPKLAHRALTARPDVSAFLPCNVTVWQDGKETVVSAMKPTAVLELIHDDEVAAVAEEAQRLLWAALMDAVPEPVATQGEPS